MQLLFTDQDFFPSFYERLGIENTATATEIARAYKKRAMETHPDRNPSDQENATKQFVAVGRAYEILKDPAHKAVYDRELGARAGQEARAEYGDYNADYAKAEFYKDFTYTEEELRRYKEASERLSNGTNRSGDLSTVFNFVAGARTDSTLRLQAPVLSIR